ncbi:hypothetical protein P261_01636 [Lachnospiraceae bacterium TWA4]|nr:hypothetical protein P261_01636 [Lachnospiraceae bacterium TWA4]
MSEFDNNKPYIKKAILKNGLVYVYDAGNFRMVGLNQQTGKVKWTTEKYSVSTMTAYCFDSSGNFYVGGYYGPNAMKINKSGRVLWNADHIKDTYYCPTKMEIKNNKLYVTFKTPKVTIKINASTGKKI